MSQEGAQPRPEVQHVAVKAARAAMAAAHDSLDGSVEVLRSVAAELRVKAEAMESDGAIASEVRPLRAAHNELVQIRKQVAHQAQAAEALRRKLEKQERV